MERITATEAIYGFASWLTCRREVLITSYKHDAARMAELVDEYVKANDLPSVRDEIYPNNLISPKEPNK